MSELFSEHPGRKGGIGGHHSPDADTHTWLTPPFILDALGPFDLDPCAAPQPRPWPTATTMWGRGDNALNRPWTGRVWLNPPYGPPNVLGPWLRRLAHHAHGTALIFARTETELFFETVWNSARAVLFIEGRLFFHHADGRQATGNAGAPSVLVAYGDDDAEKLEASRLPGKFIRL